MKTSAKHRFQKKHRRKRNPPKELLRDRSIRSASGDRRTSLLNRFTHDFADATLLQRIGLVLVPLIGAYVSSYSMWREANGNIVTGLGNNGWGDMLFHVRGAIFFAEQGGWPRESFLLSGEPVGYAFFADFISGMLWKLGVPLASAFAIPTVVLVLVFLASFEWVVLSMTKSVPAAILSALLFMGFGGVSGWYVMPELSSDWWTKLRALPHGITVWHDANILILNPFIMMFHQRGYLLGYPLLVVLLYLGWRFLLDRSLAVLAAITVAGILLAFFHAFTWLVFLFIFPSWVAWMMILRIRLYTPREIAWVSVSLTAIGLAGYVIIRALQPSAGASVITWKPGWMTPDFGWFLFWLKNIGLYPILGAVGVYYLMRRNRQLAALVLAGITPFVAANLFQFAPWDWDNTKIFAPVWLVLSIAVGSLLAIWWEQNHLAWKVAVIASLPVLMLSGALESARIVTYGSDPLVISSARDVELGEAVRNRVGKRDIVLTEPAPSHPVFMHSGRPSLVAFEGWLWSQGWRGKYEQRLADKKTIYNGTQASSQVIEKNRIAYVTIGPPELQAGANKAWFDSNYSPVISLHAYTIYDVRSVKGAPDN